LQERLLADAIEKAHQPNKMTIPPVCRKEVQDQIKQLGSGFVVGEVPPCTYGPAELGVQRLDGVGNRYEDVGAEVPSATRGLQDMVRPSGTEAPGARMCGQAVLHDELRTRVSSWPPLRLTRLRCERGSVVVVSPAAPVTLADRRRLCDASLALISTGPLARW
jgi:hypothetical protein